MGKSFVLGETGKKVKTTSAERDDEPSHDEMLKDTAHAAHRSVVHRWVSGEASDKELERSRARLKKVCG